MGHLRRPSLGLLLVVFVLSVGLVACDRPTPFQGNSLVAMFEDGTSLFPGAPVRIRGVDVGVVADVASVRGIVEVRMLLDPTVSVPTDSGAVILPLSVLGERYVQIVRGDSDTSLQDGDVIALDRTSKPRELDDLLSGLDRFASDIDEQRAARFVRELATILEGNGERLGELVDQAAVTINLLASESATLQELIDDLAALSTAVAQRTGTVERFVTDYDRITAILADNQEDLSALIASSQHVLAELVDFLVTNRQPLSDEVGALTTSGRTLVRNLDRLEEIASATDRLFTVPARAYDADRNVLRINGQFSDDALLADVITTRLADRMRGVCRRLAVQGLGPVADLAACADPAASTLDQLIGAIRDSLGGES